MSNKTDFIDLYVPESLRHVDSEGLYGSVYTKLTGLFQQVLSGQVDDKIEFLDRVDELYTYWDVLSKPKYVEMVRTLLDPYDISGLITKNTEETARLLYYIANIYNIKGTVKAFKYILRLVGMDADIIRWYEPEYKKYRPYDETCYSIVKLYVGDRAVTNDSVDLFNKLAELLLDICTVIPSWIYVKNLTDDVYSSEEITENPAAKFAEIFNQYSDYYSACSMEIHARGLDGIYGVHTYPSRELVWKLVGRWSDPVSAERDRHDHLINPEPCTDLHNSKIHFLYPKSPLLDYTAYRDNLASLIYVADTVIRYSRDWTVRPGCALTFDGSYRYDQRLPLPDDYYTYPCHDSPASYITPCQFNTDDQTGALVTQELPKYSGAKEAIDFRVTVPFFTEHGTASFYPASAAKVTDKYPICAKEPATWVIADWTMRERMVISATHDNSRVYSSENLYYTQATDIYYDLNQTYALDDISDSYIEDHGEVLDSTDFTLATDAKQTLETSFEDQDRYTRERQLVFAPPDITDAELEGNQNPSFGRYFSHEGDHYFYDGTGSSGRFRSHTRAQLSEDAFLLRSGAFYTDERFDYTVWPELVAYPAPPDLPPFDCVDHTPVINYSVGEYKYRYTCGSIKGVHWHQFKYNSAVDHLSRIYYQLYLNPRKWLLDHGAQDLIAADRFNGTRLHDSEIVHDLRFTTTYLDLAAGRPVPRDTAAIMSGETLVDNPALDYLRDYEAANPVEATASHYLGDDGPVLTSIHDSRVTFNGAATHDANYFDPINAQAFATDLSDTAVPILEDGSRNVYYNGNLTYGETLSLGARHVDGSMGQNIASNFVDVAQTFTDLLERGTLVFAPVDTAPLAKLHDGAHVFSGLINYDPSEYDVLKSVYGQSSLDYAINLRAPRFLDESRDYADSGLVLDRYNALNNFDGRLMYSRQADERAWEYTYARTSSIIGMSGVFTYTQPDTSGLIAKDLARAANIEVLVDSRPVLDLADDSRFLCTDASNLYDSWPKPNKTFDETVAEEKAQFEDKKVRNLETLFDTVLLPLAGNSITYSGAHTYESAVPESTFGLARFTQPDSAAPELSILVMDYGYDLRFDNHYSHSDGFLHSGVRLLKPGSPEMLANLH